MSFSKEVKKEILDNGFASPFMALAFLCGLFYSSAHFEINVNSISGCHITTDTDFLVDYLKQTTKKLYNNDEITIEPDFKIGQTEYYKISFANDLARQILLSSKIVLTQDKKLVKNGEIWQDFFTSEDGLKGFMAGTYIGCGTSSIKLAENGRTTTGYHIELSNQSYVLLHEISNVLAQFDIFAKLTKRKNLYVLYVKDAEQVSNVLALMGASNAVLKLQNEIITRQVRNKVNRQNNCFVSNFSKTINASYNQLEAIKVLDENIGLYNLPADIQEVALLRLANTDESLEELLKLAKTPMTKSALNHRFQKIIKLAQKIKGN